MLPAKTHEAARVTGRYDEASDAALRVLCSGALAQQHRYGLRTAMSASNPLPPRRQLDDARGSGPWPMLGTFG